MRRAITGLGLAVLLGACGQPAVPPQSATASAPVSAPSDPQQARALLQLKARIGAEPVLSNLRHGTNDGKAVLCGDATAPGAPPTPFVLRGGYLVLPGDGAPSQFATLQSFCTEDGPSPAPGS